MTTDDLVAAFALPAEARVGQRIPKTKLTEHGAPTAADRRLIQDRIEACHWVAVLKPETVALPAGRVHDWSYDEIVVLNITLRGAGTEARLVELVHRAIPYPAVVITERTGAVSLSLGFKRPAHGGTAGSWVVDSVVASPRFADDDTELAPELITAFRASLALGAQRAPDLGALYLGWSERILALDAARITGQWRLPAPGGNRDAWRTALAEHDTLSRRRATLRAEAAREPQMARRVVLNAELHGIDERLAALRSAL